MPEEKWKTALLDTGARSALKRSAGQLPGRDMRPLEAFWRAVGDVPAGKRDIWYACLCMECLWKPEEHPQVLPFEEILRKLYLQQDTSESIKRRIVAMMDIPWGRDGFLLGKICGFVKMIRAKDASVMPDFSGLADDLNAWNRPEHWVQRRWIQTICSRRSEEKQNDNKEETKDAD